MGDMADRYLDLVAEMQRIGWNPDQRRLDEIEAELIELDHQLRVTVDDPEYARVGKLRDTARTLLSTARSRHQIGLDTARAAREREAHDATYPTILSPQRNALADAPTNAIVRARERGYDRGR